MHFTCKTALLRPPERPPESPRSEGSWRPQIWPGGPQIGVSGVELGSGPYLRGFGPFWPDPLKRGLRRVRSGGPFLDPHFDPGSRIPRFGILDPQVVPLGIWGCTRTQVLPYGIWGCTGARAMVRTRSHEQVRTIAQVT